MACNLAATWPVALLGRLSHSLSALTTFCSASPVTPKWCRMPVTSPWWLSRKYSLEFAQLAAALCTMSWHSTRTSASASAVSPPPGVTMSTAHSVSSRGWTPNIFLSRSTLPMA